MHAKVNMLGTVTATDRALVPSDARYTVGKYWILCSLRKTKIDQELAEKDPIEQADMNSASANERATVG